ncbi:hypothetical protein [Limnochorda pilosa]|uniref:Uncharacterized protein n=1 Tax=Limnochorda pilosa TaxID=1555112 RepID=A0A0K2SNK3_LIMPI|nr:hypothetical protein [Limnochorda pilosa]BAS28708.1 hypothetical protein LIP_2879 [Limnochorda pilosa]
MAVNESTRVERCPACGSETVRNLVHWERGAPLEVYVACAACDSFIARYTVERYTSSESYEGLLRLLGGHVVTSERELMRELAAIDDEVRRRFERVRELAREHEDPRRIEQILYEEANGERDG